MSTKKEKHKKTTFFKIILIVFLLLLTGTSTYAYSLYNTTKQTINNRMHETSSVLSDRKGENKGSINILLLGVDERPGDPGRSDTLMVLSLNPKTKSMQTISIPRDTYTQIIGKGYKTKINHAYAFGGIDMAVATVENFINAKLDYYVKVNMEGLSDLVDAIGGIKVDNDLKWVDTGTYKKGYVYEKGKIHLNGPQTLGYVRMRHEDPRGDFGRNKRQREVIEAIVNSKDNILSVTRMNKILNVLGDNVRTNATFEEIKYIALNYKDCRKNSNSYEVKGEGTRINGTYYLKISEEEQQKLHEMIVSFNKATSEKDLSL
ncbi:LCP family protein [Strepomyces sp. STD 3.1]|nr:LCP family protein [Streptomyces sp. STD 3.1]